MNIVSKFFTTICLSIMIMMAFFVDVGFSEENYINNGDDSDFISSQEEAFRHILIGSYISLGHFPSVESSDSDDESVFQGEKSIKNEPIEWQVLSVDRDKGYAIVISRYGLFPLKFDEHNYNSVSWKDSSIRKYLNKEFLESVFNDDELKFIAACSIEQKKSMFTAVNKDNLDNDKVWLLSEGEAEKYFADDKARLCEPTEFAKKCNASEYLGHCYWWLRTSHDKNNVLVRGIGSFLERPSYCSGVCIRPCLCIKLSHTESDSYVMKEMNKDKKNGDISFYIYLSLMALIMIIIVHFINNGFKKSHESIMTEINRTQKY